MRELWLFLREREREQEKEKKKERTNEWTVLNELVVFEAEIFQPEKNDDA
jgi:hypothetical protein